MLNRPILEENTAEEELRSEDEEPPLVSNRQPSVEERDEGQEVR